jgi:hypothetical protein
VDVVATAEDEEPVISLTVEDEEKSAIQITNGIK